VGPEWAGLFSKPMLMTIGEVAMLNFTSITTNIILYCKQWDQTLGFYKNLLNLPVNFANEWFVEFRLSASCRLSVADERRASIKSCKGRGITLALEVDALERTHQQMREAGMEPTPIKQHPWDARVFYLFDPEGHRIEIWQKNNPQDP
jgi:catechol 2,3-dioxygenase-like lactoylglutathione lyase family enzyme